MAEAEIRFSFESSALDAGTFRVVHFTGEEAISRPYRFEIELAAEQADLDLAAPLGQPARFAWRQEGGRGERVIHGVVSEFEQLSSALEGDHLYRAVLVPRLWGLSLGHSSRIHLGLSHPEIVERRLIAAGFAAEDVRLDLSTDYPQHESRVQYKESDLDFISRLMEHEGLFYFFEQTKSKERLVVVDDNRGLPEVDKTLRLIFRAPYLEIGPGPEEESEEDEIEDAAEEEAEETGEEAEEGEAPEDEEPEIEPEPEVERRAQVGVWSFSSSRRSLPQAVLLQDDSDAAAGRSAWAEAAVDEAGSGLVTLTGEHVESAEEAEALARIRAEELACAGAGHSGESNSVFVSAGRVMAISQHPRSALDGTYVLTAVKHEGWQPLPGEAEEEADSAGQLAYVNAFTAISAEQPYRPPRVTPKPRLNGVLTARIDGEGPGRRAEIDEQGRYKLVMPFERAEGEEGQATRWVRQAQPTTGAGMHFPLLKGTEVIVACIEGDPDRPVILGAVPDAQQESVVTRQSRTANRIVSAGGIAMEWQDGPAGGEG